MTSVALPVGWPSVVSKPLGRVESFLAGERMERRLAAVLAADVAGYSLLMGRDEEGTLTQLKAFRKTLVDPTIAAHRGRIVKTTGDACWWSSPAPSTRRAARCHVLRAFEDRAGVHERLEVEDVVGSGRRPHVFLH